MVSRNGFRDLGRSGGAFWRLKLRLCGEGRLLAGEVVRLRNGLLEGNSRFRAEGGGCFSGASACMSEALANASLFLKVAG